jgi:hypothetical protein
VIKETDMLIHPWDAATGRAEWQDWLASTGRLGMLAVGNLDPARGTSQRARADEVGLIGSKLAGGAGSVWSGGESGVVDDVVDGLLVGAGGGAPSAQART